MQGDGKIKWRIYNSAQHDLERHAAVACLARRGSVVDGGCGVVNQIAEGGHDVSDENVHPLWSGRMSAQVSSAGSKRTGE